MTTHIETMFGKDYLIKALVMYNSATKYIQNPKFWFLCLDKESEELMAKLNLKNTVFKNVEDIGDPELMAVRGGRSFSEFAMTAKTSWSKYILDHGNLDKDDMLAHIDADIMFTAPANEMIEKCRKNGSITVFHHKFSKDREPTGKRVGIYNGGFYFFRPDEESRKCIEDYRKQCIDWCYLHSDKGRWADQKYLEQWPQKYKNVYILPDKGVNVGSWSIKSFKITHVGNSFFVDKDPLICFHFHGFDFYLNKKGIVKACPMTIYHNGIYKLGLAAVQEAYSQITKVDDTWKYGFEKYPGILRTVYHNVRKLMRDLKFKINARKYRI